MSTPKYADEARSSLSGLGRSGHPAERMLRRFVLGTTSRAENRVVVAHLLCRCERCSRAVTAALDEIAGREHR
jgi:hypothetical protein